MAPSESRLVELGRRLVGSADGSLLDAPLDRLGARITEPEAGALLVDLFEAGEADSLRDLFTGARLARWVAETATPREEHALVLQLLRWLGLGQASEDDPSRLVTVPPPPAELEGILAWARPYGLLGELTRPAREVLRDHAAQRAGEASLVECCLGRVDAVGHGESLLAAPRLEEEARAYLRREAAAHAALGAREALWKQAWPEPRLRALGERLRALVTGVELAALHAVGFVPARRVELTAETGVAAAQLLGGEGEAPIAARLFLSGYEQRALEGECARCARPGCLHVRALAARLLDACLLPGDRLHAPLLAFAEVPSWRRFLRALSPDDARGADGAERLGFRVRVEDGRASVGVARELRSSGGRWSAGKLVSAKKALRSPARAEHDRPALEAMALAARTLGPERVKADLTLLRSLAEHPSVKLEGSAAPLSIHEERVQVSLEEQPEGLLPRVTLAGVDLARRECPAGASYLLVLDRKGATLVFAALTPSLRRLLDALEHFRGVLPKESFPALAPWLASIEKVARVSTPSALRGTERPPPAKLLLRITPGLDGGVDVALMTRALPMAPLWPPGQGPELCHGLEDGVHVFVRRDLEAERARAKAALEALALHRYPALEPFAHRVEDEQAALGLLSAAARLGEALEIEWAERARATRIVGTLRAGDLKVELFKKGSWLTLGGGAHHAGIDVAIGRLLSAARRNERFVAVAGRDYVELERELFERLRAAQLCASDDLRAPKLPAAAAPFWLDRLGDRTEGGEPSTGAWLERLRASTEPAPMSAGLGPHLRGYQREGVAWLLERSAWAPGVCLADEMGLGKTAQAIALLEARAPMGPALVVAPTSVIGNWLDELARFAPSLDARDYREARLEHLAGLRPGAVLVTSYELLLRDRPRFDGIAFATQIVDEAQMVKNARTKRAQAVASVDAGFRVALSGTPVENRLGELYSLFRLVAPGLLGSWARFRGRFAAPIERYEDEERAAALRALVAPFLLRRTKREVAAELPSRTEVVHRVELSPAERDLYEAAARSARQAVGKRRRGDAARSVHILAELTRLRQLACHPRLVVADDRLESSKLHALTRLLDDVLPRGHRVLVFSQFTQHLALVREALRTASVPHLYLDGSTPGAERSRLVARFQAGEGQVFLISLKAGGTGLNLTAADYVVHMDPWWNPAAEDQASDRAHRLGQERPLTIVKLVAEGTIEEKVLELHEHKRRLVDAVIDGRSGPAPLDADALEALLSLG
jgi:superfamily II DNA or RNA helicase